jgi:hypothetical protein
VSAGLRGLIAATAVATALSAAPALNARGLERAQGVRIPGLDLVLKAGWQLLVHQHCRFAVPDTWHASPDAAFAIAPDGSSVFMSVFTTTSWPAHKGLVKTSAGHLHAVREDSDRRLWLEIGENTRIEQYVEVAQGPSVCAASIEVHVTREDSRDTVRGIVDSIGPVPEKWLQNAVK